MTTLKEHIDVLQRLAHDGVPVQELGLYYYHLFDKHLAGDKGDHLVDPTGYTITIEEFFKALETPDPEPTHWHEPTFLATKRVPRVIHLDFTRKGETPQGTKPIQGLRDPEPRRQT